MQPSISLSYSSATVEGVLGDVQAPWVGTGWNIDGVEIVRQITTDEDGYGYTNKFTLSLNGTSYELRRDAFDPTRYHTVKGSFIYIIRHNEALGNADDMPVENATGEWWEVASTDGTRYYLGTTEDSEQLSLMYGYSCVLGDPCVTPEGAYASSGYAGTAEDLVAMRWRVHKIVDTHGNYMEYSYYEEQPTTGSLLPPFDRESYMETIQFTGNDNASALPGYQVVFTRGNRDASVLPQGINVYDHYDHYNLASIDLHMCNGGCDPAGGVEGTADTLVRQYEFTYDIESNTYDSDTNYSMTLIGMVIDGAHDVTDFNATSPEISFTYTMLDNVFDQSGTLNAWTYPRLSEIDNGYGGTLSFTYEDDERTSPWYNYRVSLVVADPGTDQILQTSYTYSEPTYTGGFDGGQYFESFGSLIGYETTTSTTLDLLENPILETKHTFGIEGLDVGRELTTELIDPDDSSVLRKSVNVYVTDNSQAPFPGWDYRYLGQTENYELINSSLELMTRQIFYNDPSNGNMIATYTYMGETLFRKEFHE
jgi:hypothetical protein